MFRLLKCSQDTSFCTAIIINGEQSLPQITAEPLAAMQQDTERQDVDPHPLTKISGYCHTPLSCDLIAPRISLLTSETRMVQPRKVNLSTRSAPSLQTDGLPMALPRRTLGPSFDLGHTQTHSSSLSLWRALTRLRRRDFPLSSSHN